MTKVMLMTSPLVTEENNQKKSGMNNGLLYIGSYLKNNGHDVKLIDIPFEGWNNVRYKKDNIIEYGLSDNELEKRVADYNPDVIGVNLIATVNYIGFLEMIKNLKQKFPNKLIVAGGSHPTALPEKTLRDSHGNLDYIVHGEGEQVMKEIVENLNHSAIKSLNSIAYINNDGTFQINPRKSLIHNLDDIGKLSIDLIKDIPFTKEPTYTASTHGKKYVDLMLSRGCPNNCGFCFTPQMWERKFRKHSPNWISKTLDDYIQAGFEHFIIQDDNFSRGGDWAYQVMDLFKQKGVTWEDLNGLEVENLTKKEIKYMADTNCTTLYIPFNLRTEKTDILPKKSVEHYKKILASAKERGIYVFTSHLMGFPEQTIKGMKKQVDFAKSLVDQGLSDFHVIYAFSVLPGTRRFHQIMEPVGKGEYKVKKNSDVYFKGGWQNWPWYSINSPQIGSKNFSFEEYKKLYYDSMPYINGQKAEVWFNSREWSEVSKFKQSTNKRG